MNTNFLETAFLGIVQGFSEFLPISSSGHLILTEKLLGVEPSLLLNIVLHFGTLCAVVWFFKKQLCFCLKHPFSKKSRLVMIASAPTFLFALLAKKFVPAVLAGAILPIGFCLTMLFLVIGSLHQRGASKNKTTFLTMSKKTAFFTGLAQSLAILPGLSRSGSTIVTQRLLGVGNETSVEFSFLLSVPIIFAAFALSVFDVFATPAPLVSLEGVLALLVGFVCALIAGLVSLKLLIGLTKKLPFSSFLVYMAFPLLLSFLTLS